MPKARGRRRAPTNPTYRDIARAIAEDSIVTGALGRLIEQIVEEVHQIATVNERKRCAAIAKRRANHAYDDCERLGFADPETGQRECALEVRGGDCLCDLAAEVAQAIATEIEAGAGIRVKDDKPET